MSEFPKIALARLKAKPEAPKSSGAPMAPASFQGTDHPDANLLAAFAEKTLTEKERTQVLGHLSQCAECRTVAVFVLPEEAATVPARVAPPRRSYAWRILRWGAMTAVLGALTLVVVLHPGMWNRQPEIAKVMPRPVPAGNTTSARPSVPPPPSPPAPTAVAKAKTPLEAREYDSETAAAQKMPEPGRHLDLNAPAAHAHARREVTTMASTQPPVTIRAENSAGISIKREEGKAANTLTAGAVAAPAASPVSADVAIGAVKDEKKESAESHSGLEASRATSPIVTVGAGNSGLGGLAAPAPKSVPPPPPVTLRATAQEAMAPMRASRQTLALKAGPGATLWSVSADGKVQRSIDGGTTFERIHVARGVKFRAIASLGNNVWTGGTSGTLFHSIDGGATWTQIGIPFEGNTVTETIVRIQLSDPQHLSVTTASGAQWATEDAGQYWHKP